MIGGLILMAAVVSAVMFIVGRRFERQQNRDRDIAIE
jgi:hypothetical protein